MMGFGDSYCEPARERNGPCLPVAVHGGRGETDSCPSGFVRSAAPMASGRDSAEANPRQTTCAIVEGIALQLAFQANGVQPEIEGVGQLGGETCRRGRAEQQVRGP